MASTNSISNAMETPTPLVVAQIIGLIRKASLRRDSGTETEPATSSPSPATAPSPAASASPVPSATSQAISLASSIAAATYEDEDEDEDEDDLAITRCPGRPSTPTANITTADIAITATTTNPLVTIVDRATAPQTKHLRRFLLFLLRTDYLTFDTKSGAQISWRIPYESTLPFCRINLRLGPWSGLTPAQRSNLAATALRPAATLGIPPAAVLDFIARYQKRSFIGPTGRYKAGFHADLVKKHGQSALAAKIVRDRDVLIPALTGDWWAGEEVDESESLKVIGAKLVAAVATKSAEVFESLDQDFCVIRPDAMETQARGGKSLFRSLCGKRAPVPSPGPLRKMSLKDVGAERAAKFGAIVDEWEAWELEDEQETE